MRTWDQQRNSYKELKNYYYHLSSDGWKDGSLFPTPQLFAYGMILMGLITLRFDIVVYDFTLMPNHIHILLKGSGGECVKAFDYFRRKLSARLVRDGHPPLPDDYGFKLTPIETEEQMRTNYLYVDRNPYEKNTVVPGGYPWGGACLHFSYWGQFIHGARADQMSKRKVEALVGSRTPVPPTWEFHPELGLLPNSFLDLSMFKRLFSSPKDYETHLIKDYEVFVKLGRSLEETVAFSPEEAKDIISRLIQSTFPGRRPNNLSNDEKGRLCVLLNTQFDLPSEQIADALVLPIYLVNQFLFAKDYGKKRSR